MPAESVFAVGKLSENRDCLAVYKILGATFGPNRTRPTETLPLPMSKIAAHDECLCSRLIVKEFPIYYRAKFGLNLY